MEGGQNRKTPDCKTEAFLLTIESILGRHIFTEVEPRFFGVLTGPNAALYIDVIDALDREMPSRGDGLDHLEAIDIIAHCTQNKALLPEGENEPEESSHPSNVIYRRLVLAKWLEEEKHSNYHRTVFLDPVAQAMLHAFRANRQPKCRLLHRQAAASLRLSTPLSTPHWISLLGSSGAGKTMLAKLITGSARSFVGQHPPYLEDGRHLRRVKFIAWPKLAAQLRSGDFEAMGTAKQAWLTVVDDISAEHQARESSFIASKLYDSLSSREGNWTVFTSNLGMAGMARMQTRIASRLRRNGRLWSRSTCRTLAFETYDSSS